MKYIVLCAAIVVIGFSLGRFSSPKIVLHTLQMKTDPHAEPSHSTQLVHTLQAQQRETQKLDNLAAAPALDRVQIEQLVSQIKNPQQSFMLRRQAALALRPHLQEEKWLEIVGGLEPRMKDMIANSPETILEGYVHAASN